MTALAFCLAASLQAEVVDVDVYEWARRGTGETASGWTVSGIDTYSESEGGAVRFNAQTEFALSPVFPGVITQLVMNVRASSATTKRFLTASPVVAEDGARALPAAASVAFADQSLVWRFDEGVRRFRLQTSTGTGNAGWGVTALAVHLDDRVLPPRDLWETNSYSDALAVGWMAEARAASYEVEVSRIVPVPPSYDTLKTWNFTVLTNVTKATLSFRELDPPPELDDIDGVTLGLQGLEGGYLQIGSTRAGGTLAVPLPEGTGRWAVLNLFRHADDGDVVAYVGCTDAAGATNALAEIHLTVEPATCLCAVPDEARTFLVESGKGDDRIRVKDVAVVHNYVPESAVTNVFKTVRTVRNGRTVRGLAPGDWLWRVRANGRDGSDSDWSVSRSVRIEAGRGCCRGGMLFVR